MDDKYEESNSLTEGWKNVIILMLIAVILYIPLGNSRVPTYTASCEKKCDSCMLCRLYCKANNITFDLETLCLEIIENMLEAVHNFRMKMNCLLEKIDNFDLCKVMCKLNVVQALDPPKELVDHAVEDEITEKLSTDLLQSIERKFQVDLQRSVDMVLVKIKLLLQNGTTHIQDKMAALQSTMDTMRESAADEVDECLARKQNVTTALAEKALHQMVVCGYALIGHDPAHALRKVMVMKQMITQGLKPIQEQKTEINKLLKVCGHDHESLKKVIKCVISKSPLMKSAMMDVTGKLINGVVDLTKLMAHGAMHEACLIEVIKTIEDEAFFVVKDVQECVYGNNSLVMKKVLNFIEDNNATVIDVTKKVETTTTTTVAPKVADTNDMRDIIRRMSLQKDDNMDEKLQNLLNLQKNLGSLVNNALPSED